MQLTSTLLLLSLLTQAPTVEQDLRSLERRITALTAYRAVTRKARKTTDADESSFRALVDKELEGVRALEAQVKTLRAEDREALDAAREAAFRHRARLLLLEETVVSQRTELQVVRSAASTSFGLELDGVAIVADPPADADLTVFEGLVTPGPHTVGVFATCAGAPVAVKATFTAKGSVVLKVREKAPCVFAIER